MADEATDQGIHDTLLLYYYGLNPNWAIAVIATFLFICVTIAHLVLLFCKRAWLFIPLVIGALCSSYSSRSIQHSPYLWKPPVMADRSLVEFLAYAFRAQGLHEKHLNPSTYVTSSTLIIIAPAFISASLYQLLAHIMLANGRGQSGLIVKAGLGVGFGALDVLSFALQAVGKLFDKFGRRCLSLLFKSQTFTFISLYRRRPE